MKKILAFMFCLLFVISNFGCTNNNSTQREKKEILSDTGFKNGFNVSQLLSSAVSTTQWLYSDSLPSSTTPSWGLGQYCDLSNTRFRKNTDGTDAWRYDSSKNDLSLSTMFQDGNGIENKDGDVYSLKNKSGSKYISVNPIESKLNINIDTSKEYIDENGNMQPRVNGEDWVHMILIQSAGGIRLDQVDEIWIELEFTITESTLISSVGGASQFQWIFSIKDYDSEIGDYFWFNITLYDNRYEGKVFNGTSLYDDGKEDSTNKFIYAPSSDKFLGNKEYVEIGEKCHINMDFKPLILKAFEEAKEKGALKETKLSGLALNSLNIGWEVTNVSKVSSEISKLSLSVM